MVYVPNLKYKCYVIQDKDTIRAYEIKPYNPSSNNSININYRDYYINSHYIYKDSYQSFNHSSNLPSCITSSELTDSYYYRNDFDSILIIFIIISLVCFLLPLKIYFRLFKRARSYD